MKMYVCILLDCEAFRSTSGYFQKHQSCSGEAQSILKYTTITQKFGIITIFFQINKYFIQQACIELIERDSIKTFIIS